VNRSRPVGLPDPLAELLIFGLLAETGQQSASIARRTCSPFREASLSHSGS
jgi:hypothetical protein